MFWNLGLKKRRSKCLATLCLAAVFIVAAPGCNESNGESANGNGAGAASQTQSTKNDSLADAAKRLWEARIVEDWMVVYDFQQFRQVTETTPQQFAKWSQEFEPFVIKSYKIESQVEEGDFGWVDVDYVTSVRQFPDVPPTRTRRTEKWERIDGKWKLVPPAELDQYPAPPNTRDLEAEKEVRARYEAAWQLRLARDWNALYDMTDPMDHEAVAEVHFAEAQDVTIFVEYEVHWIEVIGDTGRIRLAIQHRINDPNLTKLPTSVIVIDEPWVKRDGEWYLDIDKGSAG